MRLRSNIPISCRGIARPDSAYEAWHYELRQSTKLSNAVHILTSLMLRLSMARCRRHADYHEAHTPLPALHVTELLSQTQSDGVFAKVFDHTLSSKRDMASVGAELQLIKSPPLVATGKAQAFCLMVFDTHLKVRMLSPSLQQSPKRSSLRCNGYQVC